MFKVVFENKRIKQEYPDLEEHSTFVDQAIGTAFEGPSPATVLLDLHKFYAIHKDTAESSIIAEARGDLGRIEVTYLVDRNSYRADADAIRIWKQGNLDLWRITLTGHLRCSWNIQQKVGKAVTKTEGDR